MRRILSACCVCACALPLARAGDVAGVDRRQIWAGREVRDYGGAISNDGRFAAFIRDDANGIWVHDLSTGQTRRVPGVSPPAGGRFSQTLISPDGTRIAYLRYSGADSRELFVVGTDGRGLRRIAKCGEPVCALEAWSPDSRAVLITLETRDEKRGSIISVVDGSSRMIGSQMDRPRFSPDGRYIVFVRWGDRRGLLPRNIAVMPARGGDETVLFEGPGQGTQTTIQTYDPMWTPDGSRVVFFTHGPHGRGMDLSAIAVQDGKAQGGPELLRKDVLVGVPLGLSRSGELYTAWNFETSTLYTAEADAQTGKLISGPKPIPAGGDRTSASWSPDGKRLAYFTRAGSSYHADSIAIRDAKSGAERTVSTAPEGLPFGSPRRPRWFPDGRSLLLHPDSGSFLILNAQSGESRPLWANLPHSAELFLGSALAPDGKDVYLTPDANRLNGDEIPVARRPVLPGWLFSWFGKDNLVCNVTASYLGTPGVSPDGSRLAFIALLDSEQWSLMTVDPKGGKPQELFRKKGGVRRDSSNEVVWSKDGRRIYFATQASDAGGHAEIWSIAAQGGGPVPLGIGLPKISFGDLHPDNRSLVFAEEYDMSALWVVKNLFATARK